MYVLYNLFAYLSTLKLGLIYMLVNSDHSILDLPMKFLFDGKKGMCIHKCK